MEIKASAWSRTDECNTSRVLIIHSLCFVKASTTISGRIFKTYLLFLCSIIILNKWTSDMDRFGVHMYSGSFELQENRSGYEVSVAWNPD